MSVKAVIGSVAAVGVIAFASSNAMADGYIAPKAAYVSYKDVAVATYNWTGVYGGFHAGYLDGSSDWTFNRATTGRVAPNFDGGVIGGQIGVNYQFPSNIVIGAEVSYTGSGTTSGQRACPNPAVQCQVKAKDEFQAVGRIGYAFDRFLPYFKGGYSNTSVRTTVVNIAGDEDSRRQDGFVIGGGLEFAVTDNIILGVDYSHIEFDTDQHRALGTGGINDGRRVDGDLDMIVGRVSYKFNNDRAVSLK